MVVVGVVVGVAVGVAVGVGVAVVVGVAVAVVVVVGVGVGVAVGVVVAVAVVVVVVVGVGVGVVVVVMTSKPKDFPPRVWVSINPEDDFVDAFSHEDCEGVAEQRNKRPHTTPATADDVKQDMHEYLSKEESDALVAEARADGEELGRIKCELKIATFEASDVGEHHAIRKMAQDRREELLVKLMRIGAARTRTEAGELGEKDD